MFDPIDPTTWTDPRFHRDWGADSATSIRMLQECSITILSTMPGVITRLVVDSDDGVLFCEIIADGGELGMLCCVQPLGGDSLRYVFFAENPDKTWEFEFYADRIVDVCHIISRVREADDLEALQEEFENSD